MLPVFAISTLAGIVLGLLVLVGLGLLFGVGVFNSLVALRNRYKNAFSQIDVQLKRRYDLILNLVESVKGYMGHEQDTLRQVIEARNKAVSAGASGTALFTICATGFVHHICATDPRRLPQIYEWNRNYRPLRGL